MSQDLSAKDLEMEQRTQAMLVNELSELTSLLKDSTMDINRAVNMQNIVSLVVYFIDQSCPSFCCFNCATFRFIMQQLTSMSGYAAENRDELDRQKKRVSVVAFTMYCSSFS